MEANLGRRHVNVIADSGYESEENYLYLEERQQTYYIKPQTYEQWKKKRFKKDISKRENILYDVENDKYICHNGKTLKMVGTDHRKSATGYRSEISYMSVRIVAIANTNPSVPKLKEIVKCRY